jgi:hypothetical protein
MLVGDEVDSYLIVRNGKRCACDAENLDTVGYVALDNPFLEQTKADFAKDASNDMIVAIKDSTSSFMKEKTGYYRHQAASGGKWQVPVPGTRYRYFNSE